MGRLSRDEAIKLVTLNPAIQLGIDSRVGSIDVGKDADLVIYNHDPLSVYAVVQKTLIDGQVYFDREQDIAQRADARKKKNRTSSKRKRKPQPEQKKADQKPDAKPDEHPKPPQAAISSDGGAQ